MTEILELDRIIPWLSISVMRFILDTSYKIGSTTGTLVTHFPSVAVIPGYPDDLTKLNAPTVGIMVMGLAGSDDDVYGEGALLSQMYLVDLWGFVVKQGKDYQQRSYRDRLRNDLAQMFLRIGQRQGIALYDESKSVVGQCEVSAVRERLIPANLPEIEAERYKFHVAVDIAYTGDADGQ